MANGIALDIGSILVDVLSAGGAGAGQRLLYEQGNMTGLLGTAAVTLVGFVGQGMFNDPMLRQAAKNLYISGLAVGGFVLTDIFFLGKEAGPGRPAFAPSEYADTSLSPTALLEASLTWSGLEMESSPRPAFQE